MTDGEGLLAAILAEPEEDTPRLAFADWLDEQGDATRAEFIRIQIELARLPGEGGPRSREQALITAHGAAWLAPLRADGEPLQGRNTHGQFRRGFVEVVWMTARWFTSRADVLFRRVPARELRVTQTSLAELDELLACPFASRLEALDLSDRRLGDAAAVRLARSRTVAGLKVLRLRGCGITDLGAFHLADADFDWEPCELDLAYNLITHTGYAALRDRFGTAVLADRAPKPW